MVDFLILGPLQVLAGGNRLRLQGTRQERLLAMLLVDAGRVVGVERLAEAMWDAESPLTAYRQVQNLAAQLRRALVMAGAAEDIVGTERGGYRMSIGDDDLDARRFDRLVRAAHAARDDDPEAAVAALREALGLWRGDALEGLRGGLVEAAATSWNERRLAVWEECLDLELALGRHAEVTAELSDLAARHPFRERLTELSMLALYRGGRQSDALAAYRRLRERLADELGIEPNADVVRLHDAILRQDPAANEPFTRARGPRPAQLPADIATFVGRDQDLGVLDALANRAGPDRPVVISAVAGTAGVGKTALAVHWAHRVAGRFPDGQLYVNLNGFASDEAAMAPGEAVRGFLDALGVTAQRVPVGLAAQAALYRSLLDGRRMLLILDNARDADQVRPLLPGADGCLAVITSRNGLAGLVAVEGAQPITLDLLPAPDARALLARRLGEARVAAEPDAVDEIVTRCARLPLALAIVAARAATNPGFGLSALAAELSDAGGGLDALAGGDSATDLRAVFSWSYRTLSAAAARLFRLLGLHPGLDIAVPAAASLAGIPVGPARALLGELARAHLVEEHLPGRYTFHDLLRAYAAELAGTDNSDERRLALHRMLDHYLHSADIATLRLHPHRQPIELTPPLPGVTPADLPDDERARTWFTTERLSLIAALDLAARHGFDLHTWQLAWALAPVLDRRGHWQDWISVQRAAVEAAQRLGDRAGQADAHRHLAGAHGRMGSYDRAHVHYRQALRLYGDLGDDTGRATMHVNLGWVFEEQERFAEALAESQQALAVFRAAGHRVGEATAGNAVGWHHARLGDFRRAVDYCEAALAVHRELGNRIGEANTSDSLGYAHHHLGDHEAAASAYRRALGLFREAGDSLNEAMALDHLGDACDAAGDPGAALAAWGEAAELYERLGHPGALPVRAKLQNCVYKHRT